MSDEFFSVEKVAELLGLHVRTVRGYVREGKLQAVRIGKQYRIAKADLEALTGKPVVVPTISRQRLTEVSSVVQINAIDPNLANRITNTLMASINGEGSQPGTQVSCQYNEMHGQLKVIISASLDSTSGLLKLIKLLQEQ